jgi:hypothetical protein
MLRPAAALLVLIALLLPAAAAEAKLPRMGVQDQRALLAPGECGPMLQVAQEGFRASVARLSVDPFAGRVPRQNHWQSLPMYDAAIRCALEHRDSHGRLRPLRVMVTVGGFAAGRGARRLGDPAYAAGFLAKVAKLRQRWPEVRYWSFINEPNISVSHVRPCLYARIYRAARMAVLTTPVTGEGAVPRPHVLFGELAASRTAQYLLRVLRCGGPPLVADALSVHAFQFRQPPGKRPGWARSGSLGNLPWLHAVLRRHRARLRTPAGGAPPFAITEFGYMTPGSYRTQWVIPERQAAAWWPDVIRIVQRPSYHVRMLMPYMVTANPQRNAWSTSLMRRDGTPRPALNALVRAVHGHLPAWVGNPTRISP